MNMTIWTGRLLGEGQEGGNSYSLLFAVNRTNRANGVGSFVVNSMWSVVFSRANRTADQSDMNKTSVRKVEVSQSVLPRPEEGLRGPPNPAINKDSDTRTRRQCGISMQSEFLTLHELCSVDCSHPE